MENETLIENYGASIKITDGGVTRFVLKSQIREVEIVRDTIIKLDIGQGALNNIFVDQAIVTTPASTGVEDLRDQIIAMFQNSLAGVATEENQRREIDIMTVYGNDLKNISSRVTAAEEDQKREISIVSEFAATLKDMSTRVNSLEDKIFYEPSLVDESTPNVVYNGFAAPGAITSDPVWAIQRVTKVKGVFIYQWAAGNKSFDKIWNERSTQLFS